MKIGQPEVGERARTPDRQTNRQTPQLIIRVA